MVTRTRCIIPIPKPVVAEVVGNAEAVVAAAVNMTRSMPVFTTTLLNPNSTPLRNNSNNKEAAKDERRILQARKAALLRGATPRREDWRNLRGSQTRPHPKRL